MQRQDNCILSLDFAFPTTSCTIPIEMVALSLSTFDGSLLFREAPGSVPGTSRSGGMMTMFSDGSGTGGTFDSFFDIFIEVSVNNGPFTPFDLKPGTAPIDPLHLVSTGAKWTTIEHGLLVDGLIGDQNANRHPQKSQCPSGFECPDFYLLGEASSRRRTCSRRTPRVQPSFPSQAVWRWSALHWLRWPGYAAAVHAAASADGGCALGHRRQ